MAKQGTVMEQPTLSDVQTQAIAERPQQDVAEFEAENSVGMFERLARDPSVDVEKIERLIAMQERMMAFKAKAEFDAAFAEMQGDLPVITERGEIKVNGEVRSTYARNEDIQDIVRPILKQHGFALRFRNITDAGKYKVIGILSHKSGHSEQDEFEAEKDTSGSKNSIQAIASTRSYGQRYTTIALLNITTRGEDDDAVKAGRKSRVPEPEGYDRWLTDLEATADNGWPALKEAWNSPLPKIKAFRKHLTDTDPQKWEALKVKAARIKA